MGTNIRCLFVVTLLALAVVVLYSVNNDVLADHKTTGGGPKSHDGSSDGESHGRSNDDSSSGHGPKKRKPKKEWKTDGNANIDHDKHFLGTTDEADLVIKTNDTEKARVTTDGDVGIGVTNPQGKLDVGERADPVEGACPIGYTHVDDNEDGLIDAGECWMGVVVNDGKVGISTASPTLTLDVNGQIRIRGFATSPFNAGWVLMAMDSLGNAMWQPVADTSATNELNTSVSLIGTELHVTDAGGAKFAELASLIDDADADPENEIQNLSSSSSNNDRTIVIDRGGSSTTFSVADNDNDSSNENNTAVSLTGTTLEVTDSGGMISTSLASLVDDADADPGNELNTSVVLNGTDLELTDAGGTKSADLASLSDNDWTEGVSDVYRLTGNVGIGTATPGSKLDVAGTVTATDYLGDGSTLSGVDTSTTNELQDLGSTVSGTERTITITDGADTTINVADNDNSPDNEIQNLTNSSSGTDRTINISGGAGITIDVADNDNSDLNEIQTLTQLGNSVTLSDSGGTVSVADNDNDSGNEIQTLSFGGTILSILNGNTVDLGSLSDTDWTEGASNIYRETGNVGIGTTSPVSKLDIVMSGGGPWPPLNIQNTDNARWSVMNVYDLNRGLVAGFGYANPGASTHPDKVFAGGNFGNKDFVLLTNDKERVTIKSGSGNVGIGTTTIGARLDVAGDIRINDGTAVAGKVLTSIDSNGLANWQDVANDGDWTINGTNMYSAVTGNVGIGTGATVPESLLTIASATSNPTLTVTPLGSGTLNPTIELRGELPFAQEGFSILYNNLVGDVFFNQIYTGIPGLEPAMRFSTGNAVDAMVIASGGNVGLGTTTPSQKLDVTGNVAVSGTVDGVDISDHAGNTIIHHIRYTDAEAQTAVGAHTADDQQLSFSGTDLSIDNGNSVSLSALQDGTGSDDQGLTGASLSGASLQIDIEDGNSATVDLSSLKDGTGTDDQTLTLSGNSLSIEDGNTVSLSSLGADNLGNHTATTNLNMNGRSITNTRELYMQNWIRWADNDGLYWGNNGWHIYPASSSDIRIRSGSSSTGSLRLETAGSPRGYLYWDSASSMGFLNSVREWGLRYMSGNGYSPNLYFYESGNESWTGNTGSDMGKLEYHSNRFYLTSGANSTEVVRFRRSGSDVAVIQNNGNVLAPSFTDINDTSYYVNPASTSYLNDLRANIYYDRNNTGFYMDPAGQSVLSSARIGYLLDRDDINYYLDPNGTSRLSGLHVAKNNGSILLTRASGGAGLRVLEDFAAGGFMKFQVTDGAAAWNTFLRVDEGAIDASRKIVLAEDGGNVGIGTTNPQGKLDVNGTIYQRGGQLHADYVFESDYDLESIREHADFMWKNRHLKAVPKQKTDKNGLEIIEVGSHRKGMLEELEKAHIYISQLEGELRHQNEELIAMKDRQSAIEDMLLALSTDLPKEKLVNLGSYANTVK
jgi:hypothetical protein